MATKPAAGASGSARAATAAEATARMRAIIFATPNGPPMYAARFAELGLKTAEVEVLSLQPAAATSPTSASSSGSGSRPVVSEARAVFVPTRSAANSHGTVHGGNVCWVIDTISSVHLNAVVGARTQVSIQLNTSFLKPVPVGRPATVTTRVIRVGRSVAYLEADIRLENGELCASATHVKAMQNAPANSPHRAKQERDGSGSQSKL